MEFRITRWRTLLVWIVASIELLAAPFVAAARERRAATKKTVLIGGANLGFGRATTE